MPKKPVILAPLERLELILIHGFRGSPIGLKALADNLSAVGYQVHTPSMPPFGGASSLASYTPENYAAYLADYIRGHDLKQPVLIGHSMGSVIAAATAHLYPNLVNRKLILLSPISGKTAKPFVAIAPLSAVVPRHIVDYATTRYLFVPHDRQLFRQALDLTHACSDDQPPSRSEMAAVAKFSAHYSVSDFRLTQNILMIAGERDRLVNKRKTIALADELQAELSFIPGSGHLHNYEKPNETTELIVDFLNR